MLTSIRKPIFLIIFVSILSSLLTVYAADKISEQHQEALEALKAEDWNKLSRISSEALKSIDKELANDWEYDGDLRIMDNQFLGDKLILVTQEYKDGKLTIWTEIHNPMTGKMEKKFKYKNFRFDDWWTPTGIGNGIVFLNLKKAEGNEKKLIVLREDAISKPIELKIECEKLNVLRQHGDQLFFVTIRDNPKLYSLNLTTGKAVEISSSNELELSEYDLFKIEEEVIMIDGENLFVYDSTDNSLILKNTLPFRYSEKDKFQSPHLFSIRTDTLYKTDLSSNNLSLSTTQMPFGIDIEDCQTPEIYGEGNWFAQVRADSLYIVDISGEVARTEGIYPFAGLDLSVKGNYLINTGEHGIRIFHGCKQTYSALGITVKRSLQAPIESVWGNPISSKGFGKNTPPVGERDSVFFFHKQLTDLIAFDLRNNRKLWSKRIYLLETEGRIINIANDYVWIDVADGSKYLLDAATGEPLSIDRNRWGLQPPRFNSDRTLFTRLANWEVLNFRISRLSPNRYLRGDLAGMSAIGAFYSGDKKEAIKYGKIAIESGKIHSEEVRNELYEVLETTGEREIASQLAGQALNSTGSDRWKKRLEKGGLVLATEPFMDDSYSFYVTGDHLTSFTNWGIEEYAYRGRTVDFHSIPLDGREISVRQLPVHSAYHIRTSEGPIIFNYSRVEGSNKISWTPILLSYSGEEKHLSPLPDTHFADGYIADRRSRIHWWIPSGTSPGKDGYLIGDFLLWGMENDKNPEYTFGVDIKGNGSSWVDETLYNAVKAGDHFYSHRKYGNRVTKIVENSQADSLKLRENDIVIGMGDHWINMNLDINDIKKLYEPGELLDFYAIREDDTLTYQIRNGKIGYHQTAAMAVVEVNPTTGEHLATHSIDDGYHFACRTTEGYLVYQNEAKLILWNPAENIKKVAEVKEIEDFYLGPTKSRLKTFWTPLETDKIILHGSKGRFIGLDLSFDTPDKKRVLWDKVIENLHDCPFTDDPLVIPFILKNSEIIYVEQATGDILFRETLPFESVWHPIVRDGILYIANEGRIIGWQLKYYQQ